MYVHLSVNHCCLVYTPSLKIWAPMVFVFVFLSFIAKKCEKSIAARFLLLLLIHISRAKTHYLIFPAFGKTRAVISLMFLIFQSTNLRFFKSSQSWLYAAHASAHHHSKILATILNFRHVYRRDAHKNR